jgi:ADP-heptose:LPS heptosyltransferase
VETRYPDLLDNHPDVWLVLRDGRVAGILKRALRFRGVWRLEAAALRLYRRRTVTLDYPFPCRGRHLIDAMAAGVGVQLRREERRPVLRLRKRELERAAWSRGRIVVQSSSTSYWTVNKEWIPGRMQATVEAMRHVGYDVIQLGSATDEPIRGTTDLRGRTSLREAAAILAQSRLLIGLEGGLVHLARAVDRRAVVIYTGYTRPEETGYEENVNLRDPQARDSCWRKDACEHCRQSAARVEVDEVVATAMGLLRDAESRPV